MNKKQTKKSSTKKNKNSNKRSSKRGQKSMTAPLAVATSQRLLKPMVSQRGKVTMVKHREYLGNIVGTVGYFSDTYQIQPGLQSSFPWLANIAQNFEQYRFKSLKYEYITRCSVTQVGSVIMSFDYDSSDSPPLTEMQQTTYEGTVEDAPWKDICLIANMASLHAPGTRKWIRGGPIPANADIKLYDSGFAIISTVDSNVSIPWGKLWVDYEVELFTPQLLHETTVQSAFLQAGAYLNTADLVFYPPYVQAGDIQLQLIAGSEGPGLSEFSFSWNGIGGYQYILSWSLNLSGSLTAITYTAPSYINLTPTYTLANIADYTTITGGTEGSYVSESLQCIETGPCIFTSSVQIIPTGTTQFAVTVCTLFQIPPGLGFTPGNIYPYVPPLLRSLQNGVEVAVHKPASRVGEKKSPTPRLKFPHLISKI